MRSVDRQSLIKAAVQKDYPKEMWDQVFRVLAKFGTESWHHEVDRVKVAVLKIAAGDIKQLEKAIETACSDYRDVLAWAEFPNNMKLCDFNASEAHKRAKAEDKKQYEEWVSRYQ